MTLFADVMFEPVVYLIEYLPLILLVLICLALLMTAALVALLIHLKKRRADHK